jgi:hypothetical protein
MQSNNDLHKIFVQEVRYGLACGWLNALFAFGPEGEVIALGRGLRIRTSARETVASRSLRSQPGIIGAELASVKAERRAKSDWKVRSLR